MQRWEYTRDYGTMDEMNPNILGAEGWELVGFGPSDNTMIRWYFIYKRPAPN